MDDFSLNSEKAQEKIKNYLIYSCIAKKELDTTIETLFSNENGLGKAWYSNEALEFANKYIKEYKDLTNEMIRHVLYTYNTIVTSYNFIASHCDKPSMNNRLDEYYEWNHKKTLDLITNYSDKVFNPNLLQVNNPETGKQGVDYEKMQNALFNFDILTLTSLEMIRSLPDDIEFYDNSVVIDSGYKTGMNKYVTKYKELFANMKDKLNEVLSKCEANNV